MLLFVHTVDGSEIRRSPVEFGRLSHYLQGFIHPRWCRISSINSMYVPKKFRRSKRKMRRFFGYNIRDERKWSTCLGSKTPVLTIKTCGLGNLWQFLSGGSAATWRIIPVSKWLITMVSKCPKWGCSPPKWPKWLKNWGYWPLTSWDDPPSKPDMLQFRQIFSAMSLLYVAKNTWFEDLLKR